MDYTTLYNAIYSAIKRDDIPHERLHVASILTADSLWLLHLDYPSLDLSDLISSVFS